MGTLQGKMRKSKYMLEYVRINPGASAAAITQSVSVTRASDVLIAPTIVSTGTMENSALQRKNAEEIEEEEWDALVQSPHGQRALHHLLTEARREIAAGKTEEGGFGVE